MAERLPPLVSQSGTRGSQYGDSHMVTTVVDVHRPFESPEKGGYRLPDGIVIKPDPDMPSLMSVRYEPNLSGNQFGTYEPTKTTAPAPPPIEVGQVKVIPNRNVPVIKEEVCETLDSIRTILTTPVAPPDAHQNNRSSYSGMPRLVSRNEECLDLSLPSAKQRHGLPGLTLVATGQLDKALDLSLSKPHPKRKLDKPEHQKPAKKQKQTTSTQGESSADPYVFDEPNTGILSPTKKKPIPEKKKSKDKLNVKMLFKNPKEHKTPEKSPQKTKTKEKNAQKSKTGIKEKSPAIDQPTAEAKKKTTQKEKSPPKDTQIVAKEIEIQEPNQKKEPKADEPMVPKTIQPSQASPVSIQPNFPEEPGKSVENSAKLSEPKVSKGKKVVRKSTARASKTKHQKVKAKGSKSRSQNKVQDQEQPEIDNAKTSASEVQDKEPIVIDNETFQTVGSEGPKISTGPKNRGPKSKKGPKGKCGMGKKLAMDSEITIALDEDSTQVVPLESEKTQQGRKCFKFCA